MKQKTAAETDLLFLRIKLKVTWILSFIHGKNNKRILHCGDKKLITIKDVEHVAKLARLELSEEEKIKFASQLSSVIEYMNQLNEVDTTGVEPMAHPYPLGNVMREDKAQYCVSKKDLLSNAPDEEDGYFKVPKINEE